MPTALVVDDEAMVRDSIALLLSTRGWKTVLAEQGQDGLEKARQNKPELIVCDINMPVMDGLVMLQNVRSDPELQTLPVIMVTGRQDRSIERALELGAQGVLLKPFNIDELLDLAEKMMT